MHDYTAKDALSLLLGKIESTASDLAERIRIAINSGKPELKKVVESSESGRGPKRRRQYWQTVPYTDEEALQVAIAVLEAHLLETRLFLETAATDFAQAGEAPPKPKKEPTEPAPSPYSPGELFRAESWRDLNPTDHLPVAKVGVSKQLVVEAEPEQVLEKNQSDDLTLLPDKKDEIGSLERIFGRLEIMADFKEVHRGDAR